MSSIDRGGFSRLINRINANDSLLKEVDLSYKRIDENDAKEISEALLGNTSVTELDLQWNNIGDAGARELAGALRVNKSIKKLDLTENWSISEKGSSALVGALGDNSSLVELYLGIKNNSLVSHMNIGEAGATELAEALRINSSLTALDLSGRNIGDYGARKLVDALFHNSSVTWLGLTGHSFHMDLRTKIYRLVEINKKSRSEGEAQQLKAAEFGLPPTHSAAAVESVQPAQARGKATMAEDSGLPVPFPAVDELALQRKLAELAHQPARATRKSKPSRAGKEKCARRPAAGVPPPPPTNKISERERRDHRPAEKLWREEAERAARAMAPSEVPAAGNQPTNSASIEARPNLLSVLVGNKCSGLPCDEGDDHPSIIRGRHMMQQAFGTAEGLDENSTTTERGCIPDIPLEYLEYCTYNWEESRLLGKGGNGAVFLGKDAVANVTFAVKCYHEAGGAAREVRILSKFHHPYFIQLLAKTPATCSKTCLVLEYMPMGSLAAILEDCRAKESYLTLPRRISIASHVTAALCYLHHFGEGNEKLYHRDIKSANICLDDDYTAKLIDCGISKIAAKDATHVTNTGTGTIGYGTWGYSAPEFAMDPTYYTEECEVFSLGIVFLELVIGRVTKGASLYQQYVMRKRPLDYDNNLLAQHGGTVSETLKQFGLLALKCASSTPDDRGTLREVLEEVNDLVGHSFGGADTTFDSNDATKCMICHDLVGTNSSCGRHYLCNTDFCNHVLRHLEMKTIPCVQNDCAACFTDAQIGSFSLDLLVQYVAARTRAEERGKESSLLPILKQIGSDVSDVKNITAETRQKLVFLSTRMLTGLISLASGRVSCPSLFLVVPENTKPEGLGSPKRWVKRFTHKRWLLYFVCAHDKKPVCPPIKIDEPKMWLRKAAPYLKLMFLAMQVAVKATTSITFDLSVVPIPGEDDTKLEGLIDFTNQLLGSEISKKIDDYTAKLEKDGRLADAIEEFGPEMHDACDRIAEKGKESNAWRREMVQVNMAEGIMWVRNRYAHLYNT